MKASVPGTRRIRNLKLYYASQIHKIHNPIIPKIVEQTANTAIKKWLYASTMNADMKSFKFLFVEKS
jgi:hypothetical protein